jgi:hypothetical protein
MKYLPRRLPIAVTPLLPTEVTPLLPTAMTKTVESVVEAVEVVEEDDTVKAVDEAVKVKAVISLALIVTNLVI